MHVAPFGFPPWTCFSSVQDYVNPSSMRLDVTGTDWFLQSFCPCSFLKESASIAGYIYSCFQKTNSSHIYRDIYIYPQRQSICISVFRLNSQPCMLRLTWLIAQERSTEILKFAKASCQDDIEDGRSDFQCPVLKALWKADPKKSESWSYYLRGIFIYIIYKFMHVYFMLSLQHPFKTINCINIGYMRTWIYKCVCVFTFPMSRCKQLRKQKYNVSSRSTISIILYLLLQRLSHPWLASVG